jgi:hypothetical protein
VVAEEYEGGVGAKQQRIQLEGELLGIGGVVELAAPLRLADQADEHLEPLGVEVADPVPDGTFVAVELSGRGDEEAAARKDAPLEVGEERLAEAEDLRDALRLLEPWAGDLAQEVGYSTAAASPAAAAGCARRGRSARCSMTSAAMA